MRLSGVAVRESIGGTRGSSYPTRKRVPTFLRFASGWGGGGIPLHDSSLSILRCWVFVSMLFADGHELVTQLASGI